MHALCIYTGRYTTNICTTQNLLRLTAHGPLSLGFMARLRIAQAISGFSNGKACTHLAIIFHSSLSSSLVTLVPSFSKCTFPRYTILLHCPMSSHSLFGFPVRPVASGGGRGGVSPSLQKSNCSVHARACFKKHSSKHIFNRNISLMTLYTQTPVKLDYLIGKLGSVLEAARHQGAVHKVCHAIFDHLTPPPPVTLCHTSRNPHKVRHIQEHPPKDNPAST